MSKPLRLPSYRLHKPTGQGVTTIRGRDLYLGAYNTPESLQRYHETVANYLAGKLDAPDGPTVADVLKR